MSNLASKVTIEQACLAFAVTCFASIALLVLAETKLGAKLHVAKAAFDNAANASSDQNSLPDGCIPNSLDPLANDVRSFDPRMGGYTQEQARALLCAMHVNDRSAAKEYLDNRFFWDMLYPIIYGPALAIILLFLLGRVGVSGWWVYAVALIPLAGAGFDIAENFAVRELIQIGPTANPAAIDFASRLTAIKLALVVPVFIAASVGMLVFLGRRSLKPLFGSGSSERM